MSWVYTLTAQGTTHGFERGYFAFLGDPFGAERSTGNLTETIAASTVPEATTPLLMLLGFGGLLLWHCASKKGRVGMSRSQDCSRM